MRQLFKSLYCRNGLRPVRQFRATDSRSAVERLEQRCLLSADSSLPGLDAVSDVALASPDVSLDQNVSTAWFERGPVALDSDRPADRWIVRLTAAATDQAGSVAGAQELLASADVPAIVVRGLGLPGMLLIALQSSDADLPATLESSPLVEYFTRDLSVEAQTLVPDDTDFAANQYSFDNTGQFFGTSNADINAPEAWDLFPESDPRPGSHDVVVSVIDSGVEYTHPDLARNIWINQGEIPAALSTQLEDTDGDGLITFVDLNQVANSALVTDGNGNGFIDGGDLLSDPTWENGVDDDGNGLTDDLIGWDFLNNDNDPIDDHRHGTHVAGTIGAVGDNSLGVSGVNWDVSIMPLKFLNTQLTGSTSNAILAINYATLMRSQFDTNVRVMNASWGTLDDFNPDLQDALTAAQSADILFVAAAGNGNVIGDGVDLDNDVGFYPASFDLENIIAVAASDNSDNLARFSNFGATSVDLAAPGVGIFGLNLGDGFIFRTGTSMAAPHVTGTVALLASLRPLAIASELRDAIITSVRSVSGLNGDVASGGVLNAQGALTIDTFAPLADFAIPASPPADVTTDGGTTQTIDIRYVDDTSVNVSTLGDTDIIVRRQDDGAEFAAPLPFPPNNSGPDLVARYVMTPPGGTWLLEDNGIYEVILQAGEVADTGGRVNRETVIGSFEVAIAFAGQIDVTTTSDGTTAGTLRSAVQAANLEAGLNTIALRTGETYTLDISGAGEDASATGDLDITDADGLVIRGNGATIAVVGGIDRVFDIQSSGALTLLDVTITGGSVNGDGGGIHNNGGTLTIDRSLLTGNTATSGGALASTGTTTLINTTISGNNAANGAGIDHTAGTLLLSGSSGK
jgi:subtilisin family serine protease